MDTIATGHRANIFSARFLPNAGTPTIVSCAGDRDVRVFEVERLGRAELGLGNSQQELYGVEGPGYVISHTVVSADDLIT
jgi:nuclear receptor interaction protein